MRLPWGGRRPGPAWRYAHARAPAGATPWREGRYCAVDLELTGLDPRRDEIVAFGAVPIEDGRAQLGGARYALVRPSGPLSESAIRVHGLRAADLEQAPPLGDALGELLEAMSGRVLVAHVASVERAFLGAALRRAGARLRGPVIDTAPLTRLWLLERDGVPVSSSMTLADLARACDLPAHSPHTAIGDALTTAQLLLATATHLDARAPETVRSLTRAGERLAALSRLGAPGPGRRSDG